MKIAYLTKTDDTGIWEFVSIDNQIELYKRPGDIDWRTGKKTLIMFTVGHRGAKLIKEMKV